MKTKPYLTCFKRIYFYYLKDRIKIQIKPEKYRIENLILFENKKYIWSQFEFKLKTVSYNSQYIKFYYYL